MGIRSSYIDEAAPVAESFVGAIAAALRQLRLSEYVEGDAPDVYQGHLFGRSALDHHSARCLVDIAALGPARGHLALIAKNPFRVAFLPTPLVAPLQTEHEEIIAGDNVKLWVGSAHGMLDELVAIAPQLQIPLERGALPDAVATAINDFAPLYDGDPCDLAEDERTAWLLLYEGARLAIQYRTALSLAG